MAKSRVSIPADALALYDKLVTTLPGVERKGASMPYTSVERPHVQLPDQGRHARITAL